jgi:long-chain acyl-CoA synthetase
MEQAAANQTAVGSAIDQTLHPNLAEAFLATVDEVGDAVAIRTGDESVSWTWSDLSGKASAFAGALAALGVERGETVALMLDNRPEFIPLDLGAVMLGAVPFSIYQTLAPEEIEYLIRDAGAKVVFVEEAYSGQMEQALAGADCVEKVVVLADSAPNGWMTLVEFEALDPDYDPSGTISEIDEDSLLTLIYTSGTTGPPKGVELTHRNLMTLVAGIQDLISFEAGVSKVISWLPAAHIAERGAHYYLPVISGAQITICPNPREIVGFLPQVQPSWFFAVPRIFEKLKAGIEAMIEGKPEDEKAAAREALSAAVQKVRLEQRGEEVPEDLAAAVAKADQEMFAGLRKMLGLEELEAVNVGAAPTPVETLEFFHAIGIPIGELWGMSETCGVATCNPPGRVKIGTVGPPVAGVSIKLADDGEVMVKADSVMRGYRNLPEKTAETIDGEWLLTGDIGTLDEEGYLSIVDRKKEIIINAAGKNMSPANIEGHLKSASPLIGSAVAIGDNRPYNVALLTLDPDFAPVWAQQQGLEDTDIATLAQSDRVREALQAAVDEANEKLARVEQIKKFAVLPEVWMPGGDELTPTMKLKRKPIDAKYSEQIEGLYGE